MRCVCYQAELDFYALFSEIELEFYSTGLVHQTSISKHIFIVDVLSSLRYFKVDIFH